MSNKRLTIVELVQHIQHANTINNRIVFDALALCAESGELANIVKKTQYYPNHPNRNDDIVDEMTDVLFHLVSLCTIMDVTLEQLIEKCIDKHSKRWNI